MIMCYRFLVEDARKDFFREYRILKLDPDDPIHRRLFYENWIHLQFSKLYEKPKKVI